MIEVRIAFEVVNTEKAEILFTNQTNCALAKYDRSTARACSA